MAGRPDIMAWDLSSLFFSEPPAGAQRQPLAENPPPIDPPVRATPLFTPHGGAQLTSFASPQVPSTTQRTQTPFAGAIPSTSGTSVGPPPPEPQLPQPQVVQPPQQERAHADIASVLQPLPTPNPAVYGPPPLQQQPSVFPRLANPLPSPPRDLYELSPYNTLLNLPQTTALLTAAYDKDGALQPQSSYGRRRGTRTGGLLRALTGRGRKEEEEVRYVPVFIGGQSNGVSPATEPAARTAPQPPPPPPSNSQRTVSSTEPVRFSSSSFPGFLNYSPHRIMFNGAPYPSAMHLYEAMKFLPNHPELAEQIRLCSDVAAVFPLSLELQQQPNVTIRGDWNSLHLEHMEEAILNKFRQHPDLRAMLLGTGNAPLIYADEADVYWGEGSPGQEGLNHLGHILERVRARLS
ncbi:hypothetical protein FB45DRAFT_104758 [Roridomyces roridus]|uniref:NADAR domain-containing protein n=1 Tax=Roridomyces roridus TaxID=1738132 RepID=A0AAD7BKH2_9AGAR|nr:hypothetical protein FB45DRAFT_104758 [Roridomyces roridus]